MDEIKALKQFLATNKQQSGDPDEAVADLGADFIDMDDLIEAV